MCLALFGCSVNVLWRADPKQKQEPSQAPLLLSTTDSTKAYYNLTPLAACEVIFNKEFESCTHLTAARSCSNTGTMLQVHSKLNTCRTEVLLH